jgi:Lipocalin-like domain
VFAAHDVDAHSSVASRSFAIKRPPIPARVKRGLVDEEEFMGWNGAWVLALAAAIAPTLVQKDEAVAIKQRLLGSWRLVTWEEHDSSGRVNHPLGRDAVGQITYTPDDRMSAQLMRQGPRRFASEDWRRATPDEKSWAWSDYFGYFGTYRIDLAQKAVIHHIEGAGFPTLSAPIRSGTFGSRASA